MENKHFVWDDQYGGLVLSGLSKDENDKKKIRKQKSKVAKTKIYFPHKHLIFNFRETLSFTEQTRFQKLYERSGQAEDVVLLQDVKNLALYCYPPECLSRELCELLHLPGTDRLLRGLVLYLQHYLSTWRELSERRAASGRRLANPLAGGARVRRAAELRALRCLLGREYAELLGGGAAPGFHHARAGRPPDWPSNAEKDLRLFEALLQVAHRVVWLALERKHNELIEVELHRLFRTDAFNSAKRKYLDAGLELEIPKDERWILYGPEQPARRKILGNSPLPWEILNTDCDYRVLSLGLTKVKSEDPRIVYLENALLAKESDLPRLGIKVGILGLPRSDFDSWLIPQTSSEDDKVIIDESSAEKNEEADDYETLMPAYGADPELSKPFPMTKLVPRHAGDDAIRNNSRKIWTRRGRALREEC